MAVLLSEMTEGPLDPKSAEKFVILLFLILVVCLGPDSDFFFHPVAEEPHFSSNRLFFLGEREREGSLRIKLPKF